MNIVKSLSSLLSSSKTTPLFETLYLLAEVLLIPSLLK
ncbi:hypothetical protein NNO_0043 [Hydrogenimonas sp.]|nr:hypothetical protein NNO_0043 [Hydrogenimonas sp.]